MQSYSTVCSYFLFFRSKISQLIIIIQCGRKCLGRNTLEKCKGKYRKRRKNMWRSCYRSNDECAAFQFFDYRQFLCYFKPPPKLLLLLLVLFLVFFFFFFVCGQWWQIVAASFVYPPLPPLFPPGIKAIYIYTCIYTRNSQIPWK